MLLLRGELGTRYELEILDQYGKKVKTKSQKILGDNSYVCRSYRGKTGRGAFLAPCPPILNMVKENVHIHIVTQNAILMFLLDGWIFKKLCGVLLQQHIEMY